MKEMKYNLNDKEWKEYQDLKRIKGRIYDAVDRELLEEYCKNLWGLIKISIGYTLGSLIIIVLLSGVLGHLIGLTL